jgi:hypothetical protein
MEKTVDPADVLYNPVELGGGFRPNKGIYI